MQYTLHQNLAVKTCLTATVCKQAGDPQPKVTTATSTPTASGGSTGMGLGLYAVLLLGGAAAFGAYKYMESQKGKQ